MCFRNHSEDRRKSARKLREQFEANLICSIPECGKPLTTYQGPHETKLCRDHQVMLREYGGMARMDRPYTFHKEMSCDCCGYNPFQDPWFDNPPVPWDNEEHKQRAMRAMLVVDHIVRQADGGKDTKENSQTFCHNCNSKKSMNNKDYLRRTLDMSNTTID